MKKKIIDFALLEAASGNWSKVSPAYISQKLNIDTKKIKNIFSDKEAILDAYIEILDGKVIKTIDEDDKKEASQREILLELLMIRLDLMKDNKLALANIVNI